MPISPAAWAEGTGLAAVPRVGGAPDGQRAVASLDGTPGRYGRARTGLAGWRMGQLAVPVLPSEDLAHVSPSACWLLQRHDPQHLRLICLSASRRSGCRSSLKSRHVGYPQLRLLDTRTLEH